MKFLQQLTMNVEKGHSFGGTWERYQDKNGDIQVWKIPLSDTRKDIPIQLVKFYKKKLGLVMMDED